jgi:hypothetical protein
MDGRKEFRVMSLLRKRYDFAFGKSYDMIARFPQRDIVAHNLA